MEELARFSPEWSGPGFYTVTMRPPPGWHPTRAMYFGAMTEKEFRHYANAAAHAVFQTCQQLPNVYHIKAISWVYSTRKPD